MADSSQAPTKNPVVSVVMAVYNGMPFLQQAVESVLIQTLEDFEFIVVDDGSTDQTSRYLRSISDPRLILFHQSNQGQQAAANLAISHARGKYIARLDADDFAFENRLEKQAAFLNANPDVVMVGSQISRMGASGVSGVESNLPTQHKAIYDELIENRHAMCNSSTMFRKSAFVQCGGYWDHSVSEDWDLFLRFAEIGKLANINETLTSMRFHSGSINARRMLEAQQYNLYACELARRRTEGLNAISFEEFDGRNSISKRFKMFLMRLDCASLHYYRNGMANLLDGNRLRGYLQLMAAITFNPNRLRHRLSRFLFQSSRS
ncbi:MAG: glycosyltransferase [Planctomycetota bacterium]